MNVVYVVSTGTSDPTTASVPIHLAVNGSVPAGQSPSLVFAGNAAELIVGDTPETLEGIGLPPLRELLAAVREHAVPVYV